MQFGRWKKVWFSEEAPHRSIIGEFCNFWGLAIYQFGKHLLFDEIPGRQMSVNGKHVQLRKNMFIHSRWRLLLFAHIAPSQLLHTDSLVRCARGHDGVYLVFFMFTRTRRTHGQVLTTFVISLYSSLDCYILLHTKQLVVRVICWDIYPALLSTP